MTIFDIIAGILFTKKNTCLSSIDEESSFSPYLINRWASMYSPKVALVSNTINKYLGIFDNKQDLYSLFAAVLPKVPSKRIQYFKKVKREADEKDENINLISKNLELSTREIEQYIAFLKK